MNTFKHLFSLFFVVISFTMINCQNSKNDSDNNKEVAIVNKEGDKPFLKIKKELNFGEIDKEKVPKKEFTIEITNTGNSPLVIIKADVACGCITTTYTEHPIQKGEKGFIKVEINTRNQNGYFNKSIIVKSNAQNNLEIIRVKGFIQ